MAQTNFRASDMIGSQAQAPVATPEPAKKVAPAPKAKKVEAPVVEESPVVEAEAPAEETE